MFLFLNKIFKFSLSIAILSVFQTIYSQNVDINNIQGISIVTHKNFFDLSEKDILKIKKAGYNSIRLRISSKKEIVRNINKSDSLLFKKCHELIKFSLDHNLSVLISVSDFPLFEEYNQWDEEFWESEYFLKESLDYIAKIINEFDDYPNVYGYQFFAEPVIRKSKGNFSRPLNWFSHANSIVNLIRKYSEKYILIAPGPWGLIQGYKNTKPFIENSFRVIYTFHFYEPQSYTHQDLQTVKKINYPGFIKFRFFNKNFIYKKIKYIHEWSKKYKFEVILTEYGCSKYAQNHKKYLKDLNEVLTEFNIPNYRFNYNGWDGFSLKRRL